MPDAIDMLLADVTGKTTKHCTLLEDRIHYVATIVSPGRVRMVRGAVTRDAAVEFVGARLVLRADAEPGVMQEEVER